MAVVFDSFHQPKSSCLEGWTPNAVLVFWLHFSVQEVFRYIFPKKKGEAWEFVAVRFPSFGNKLEKWL